MSVRSMTGFARIRKSIPDGEIVFSIKSVNHRGLDMHFHLPAEMDALESGLRTAIKSGVARGHLQVTIALSRTAAADGAALNGPLLDAWIRGFREAAARYQLDCRPDLNTALQIPGMLATGVESEVDEDLAAAILAAAEEALAMLNESREREGAAMATEMRQRCATICALVTSMEEIRAGAAPAFQARLRERLSDLLNGAGLEPQRLAQEAAILADRSDVSEELVRLRTHAAQLQSILTGSGEVGKRLDFLLQEMNREANTVLSKTGGLGELGLTMTDLALAAKAEIDKIREQSLNLE